MKVRNIGKTIGGAVLTLSLLGSVAFAWAATVQAQNPNDVYIQQRELNTDKANQRGRNWERYGSYGGSNELRQTALNAGFTEGTTEGQQNRGTGRHVDLRSDGTYQRATKGYTSSLGDRELYRRYFREAFEDAYNGELSSSDDGRDKSMGQDMSGNQANRNRYRDGYGSFGGTFRLRQTALNAGYNEGARQGRIDFQKHDRSDFKQRSAYQKATKDYSTGLGDREIYQRYYREAYEHGYNSGVGGN
ncbi:MAG TPA: hypothetical protein VI306_03540 [Pyrinomonadaceae bacterium]